MNTPDPAADLDQFLAAAAGQLNDAATHSKLADDPLRLPFQALSLFMLAQRKVFAEWRDKTHEAVNEDILKRAVTRGIQDCARETVRALNVRSSLIGAGMIVGVLVVGTAAGYWLGHRDGLTSAEVFERLSSSEAGTWARLMANNPGNAAGSLKSCEGDPRRIPGSTRRACFMPVWIDPPVSQAPP